MTEAATCLNISAIRQQFPALRRGVKGRPAVYFDGPAGSQVPFSVADAVHQYLLNTNANRGGRFATKSDAALDAAHAALADFVGAADPREICFGANMTTITLQVSRALARTWKPGDEIIVSRLDHDANFTPWILAAEDVGVRVHRVGLRPEDATLDLEDFERNLSDRTRLVAVGYAANSTGTINPVEHMTRLAHDAGALVYVDAVHFAPHGRIQAGRLGCDFLVCSAYKFFGPHVGVLWGRRGLLEEIQPYKVRPAPNTLPGRWMTGTQNHEGIVGAGAAVNYLAALSNADSNSPVSDRTDRLDMTFRRIVKYEQSLTVRLLIGLSEIPGINLHGIRDVDRVAERVPTVSLTVDGRTPDDLATALAGEGIFVWSGNHYAQPFTEAAGLEPHGTMRIGALHYNTTDEIDQVVRAIHRLTGTRR